jgi:hypothetical protein
MKPPSNERPATTWASSDKKPEADLTDTRKPLKEDDPRRLLTTAPSLRADLPVKDPPSLSSAIVSATSAVLDGKPKKPLD